MMNRRSGLSLRERHSSLTGRKRKVLPLSLEEKREFERNRKRAQRSRKAPSLPTKRGRKETIGVKNMSVEQLKEYERNRKALQRRKKITEKSKERMKDIADDQDCQSIEMERDNRVEDEVDDLGEHDIDLQIYKGDSSYMNNTDHAKAILHMVKNSPKKTKKTFWTLTSGLKKETSKLSEAELLDVIIMLTQDSAFSDNVKVLLQDIGVQISKIPRSQKRLLFSTMSKTSRHRYKETLLTLFKDYDPKPIAEAVVKVFSSTAEIWLPQIAEMKRACGIELDESLAPAAFYSSSKDISA